jgi:hypothetical protein
LTRGTAAVAVFGETLAQQRKQRAKTGTTVAGVADRVHAPSPEAVRACIAA